MNVRSKVQSKFERREKRNHFIEMRLFIEIVEFVLLFSCYIYIYLIAYKITVDWIKKYRILKDFYYKQPLILCAYRKKK